MKKKLLSILFFSLLAMGIAKAQKIKIKKGIVYIDGTECLKVSGDATSLTFSNLEGEEIIYVKYFHSNNHTSTYNTVRFLEQEQELSSATISFTKKYLVKKLIETGALKDCSLNDERVEKFILRYDEGIRRRRY